MPTDICSGEWRRRLPRWWSMALQISTTILLTLFLPLSFLLLARLSAASAQSYYDFNGGSDDFLAFLFLCFNLAVLYLLISFVAVAAFVRGLTGGRVTLVQLLLCQEQSWAAAVDDQGSQLRPYFSVAWLFLCSSVIFAELGIEFQLNGDQRSSPSSDYHRNRFLSGTTGLLLAVGLYETMLYWSESWVKPVVEDVVVGMMGFTASFSDEEAEVKERRSSVVERIGLGLSFGALWWWRLRDHLDSLAVVPAASAGDPLVVLKAAGFVSLGLYYLTLFTGAIRAFTGATAVMQLIVRREGGGGRLRRPPTAAAGNKEHV